jgi:hypothetical protein
MAPKLRHEESAHQAQESLPAAPVGSSAATGSGCRVRLELDRALA